MSHHELFERPLVPGARPALASLLLVNLFSYVDRYVLAAVVGVGWVTYLVLTWRKRQAAGAPTGAAPPGADSPTATSRVAPPDDEYTKRVERELHELD